MKYITLFFLFFIAFQVSAQEIRTEIKTIVEDIAQYNILESEFVGAGGTTTDQYRNFIRLKEKATFQELLLLLRHNNSVVKGYASWALVDRKYPNLTQVLKILIANKDSVATQYACIGSFRELSSVFYNRVYYSINDNNHSDSLLYRNQMNALDSLIIYSNNDGFLRYEALSNNNANPKTYDRIRYLAFCQKDLDAIEALSYYQKKEDIPEFIQLGDSAFTAIMHFPSPEFWDLILRYKKQYYLFNYLFAVSAFKSEQSNALLSEILLNLDKKGISNLSEAITKYYCVHYNDLLIAIWEKYQTISLEATKQLINNSPTQSVRSFAKVLLNNTKLNFIEFERDYGSKDSILELMLENIKLIYPNDLIKICTMIISADTLTNLDIILNFCIRNDISEICDPCLARLSKDIKNHEMFLFVKAILYFNNSKYNAQLTEILKSKRKIWDVKYWSDSYKKLLYKYNINLE